MEFSKKLKYKFFSDTLPQENNGILKKVKVQDFSETLPQDGILEKVKIQDFMNKADAKIQIVIDLLLSSSCKLTRLLLSCDIAVGSHRVEQFTAL